MTIIPFVAIFCAALIPAVRPEVFCGYLRDLRYGYCSDGFGCCGKHCCASDQTCCGNTYCCSSSQTCRGGTCYTSYSYSVSSTDLTPKLILIAGIVGSVLCAIVIVSVIVAIVCCLRKRRANPGTFVWCSPQDNTVVIPAASGQQTGRWGDQPSPTLSYNTPPPTYPAHPLWVSPGYAPPPGDAAISSPQAAGPPPCAGAAEPPAQGLLASEDKSHLGVTTL